MSHLTSPRQIAIIGRGRLGSALAACLSDAGHTVLGPLQRTYEPADLDRAEIVLLCVPDREITGAATVLAGRLTAQRLSPMVGHCSGASSLDVLQAIDSDHRFSLHPLMTVTGEASLDLRGATAAVAGSSSRALDTALGLAEDLRLSTLVIEEADRAAYHAAASMASNFLLTLESAAERLMATAGADRQALLPLVRQTVENWARQGSAALTGPIARGDLPTVTRQREAIAQRTPELLGLYDALAAATSELAREPVSA